MVIQLTDLYYYNLTHTHTNIHIYPVVLFKATIFCSYFGLQWEYRTKQIKQQKLKEQMMVLNANQADFNTFKWLQKQTHPLATGKLSETNSKYISSLNLKYTTNI
jgi:hypothetical protein